MESNARPIENAFCWGLARWISDISELKSERSSYCARLCPHISTYVLDDEGAKDE